MVMIRHLLFLWPTISLFYYTFFYWMIACQLMVKPKCQKRAHFTGSLFLDTILEFVFVRGAAASLYWTATSLYWTATTNIGPVVSVSVLLCLNHIEITLFMLLIKLNWLCNENNCLDLNAIFTTPNLFFSSGKHYPRPMCFIFFKGQGHQGIFLLGRGQSKEIVNFFWSISRTPIRPGVFLQLQNNTQYYIVGYSVVILQVSPHFLPTYCL